MKKWGSKLGAFCILIILVIAATCSACGAPAVELNAPTTQVPESLFGMETSIATPTITSDPAATALLTSAATTTNTPTPEPITAPQVAGSLFGTETSVATPTSTLETTATALHASTPTATNTPMPEPVETSSRALAAGCRDSVAGIQELTNSLGLPDHLREMRPEKREDVFDVNTFFLVLDRLSLEEGYVLDFVYFADNVGGKPLVYARPVEQAPFVNYAEFIESKGGASFWEHSYSTLEYAFEYLDFVHVDDTVDGYLQFAILATAGDQFYLSWHANYHDEVILCDNADLEKVAAGVRDAGFDLELPDEIIDEAQNLNLEPTVTLNDESATIRFVIFTKWGGFIEVRYVLSREYPHRLIEATYRTLVGYDCGILF